MAWLEFSSEEASARSASGLSWPRPVRGSPFGEIRSHKATGSGGEALRTSNLLHLDTGRFSDRDEWKDEKGLAWSS